MVDRDNSRKPLPRFRREGNLISLCLSFHSLPTADCIFERKDYVSPFSCATVQRFVQENSEQWISTFTVREWRKRMDRSVDDVDDDIWRVFSRVLSRTNGWGMQRLRTLRNRVDGASPSAWVPCRATAAARLNAARSSRESRWLFAGDIPRPSPSRSSSGSCTYASADTLLRTPATPTGTAAPRIPGCWRSSDCILQTNKINLTSIVRTKHKRRFI